MSFNIPKALCDVVTTIDATVDTQQLGPRQRSTLKRMLKDGILKGYSVPTLIAKNMRKAQGLPWFHLGRYGRVSWGNIPKDSQLWDKLLVSFAVARLAHDNTRHYHRYEALAEAGRIIESRPSESRYLWLPFELDIPKVDFPPAVWDEKVTLLPITIYEDGKELI